RGLRAPDVRRAAYGEGAGDRLAVGGDAGALGRARARAAADRAAAARRGGCDGGACLPDRVGDVSLAPLAGGPPARPADRRGCVPCLLPAQALRDGPVPADPGRRDPLRAAWAGPGVLRPRAAAAAAPTARDHH